MLEITDVAELTECHHHSGSAPWPTRATSTISPWAHCGFTAVPKTGVRSVTVPLWEQLWGLLETPPQFPYLPMELSSAAGLSGAQARPQTPCSWQG